MSNKLVSGNTKSISSSGIKKTSFNNLGSGNTKSISSSSIKETSFNNLGSGNTKSISSSGIKKTSFNNLDDFKAGLREKEDIATEELKAKLEMSEIKDKTSEDLVERVQRGKKEEYELKSPEVILPVALLCILILFGVGAFGLNLISEKTHSGNDCLQASDQGVGISKTANSCLGSFKS